MFKHFLIPLFLFVTLLGWQHQACAQSTELHAIVTLNNGQVQDYFLTENDLFSFDDQDHLVIHAQGATAQINIDNIRKIVFSSITGTEEILTGEPFFYPNPVKKTISIGNIEPDQQVSIYSLEGRLLKQFNANANEPIDLSELPAGIYILNTNNKNLKLLKQ